MPEITVQVFAADVVIDADDSALYESVCALCRICVIRSPRMFAGTMIHCFHVPENLPSSRDMRPTSADIHLVRFNYARQLRLWDVRIGSHCEPNAVHQE